LEKRAQILEIKSPQSLELSLYHIRRVGIKLNFRQKYLDALEPMGMKELIQTLGFLWLLQEIAYLKMERPKHIKVEKITIKEREKVNGSTLPSNVSNKIRSASCNC
jgi:hypothetical protein